MAHRITGLPRASANIDDKEVVFELNISNGQPMSFVAKFGVISQVISGLARVTRELEKYLRAENAAETSVVEKVIEVHVQKERWHDVVILRMTTPQGVPYTFGIPSRNAAELAEMLKNESAKPTQTGNA